MTDPETAAIPDRGQPRWPLRLQEVCNQLQSGRMNPARDTLIGEAWLLIKSALSRYLRFHAARLGPMTPEDLEDIASEKAFDLLCKIELKEWDMSGRHATEIQSYLSHTARNGLVNWLKKSRRHVRESGEDRQDGQWETPDRRAQATVEVRPDVGIERREFIDELQKCFELLNLRDRRIWFLRVFCEMKTKEIARHPEVGLKPGHVDVLMQRSRSTVRECMQNKGFGPGDVYPGTFTALWKTVLMETHQP
jgi:RNA polymerase sigma factor (sigma-70 family)